ncbi:hypothetical protein [Actinoplanes sp. NPDC026623]
MSDNQDQRRHLRDRLTAAAVTGLLAGAARALAGWLLQHLTHGG